MRKRTILSIIASLLFVLSCDDVNELIPDDNKVFALEKDSISLSWQEQSLKINVQTITDFTVSSNCDWISVTKQYSDEKSFIELSVDENPDTLDSRIGIITLVANDIDATATLHVTQGYNNINFLSLRKLLRENPKVSIFYSALVATHLADSLYKYIDESYPSPQYDSTYASLVETGRVAVEYETNWENFQNGQQQRVVWPDQRLFKYTVFVVTDSVLDREYGIKSLNDLEAKAREVYDNPDHINDSPELSTSPLYKLMSYHILPCGLNYNQLNPSGEEAVDAYLKAGVKNEMDIDAYYETMQPYAIMRISTPYDSLSENPGNYIYINRKGTVSGGNLESEGIRIWRSFETPYVKDAKNGSIHFVGKLLLFDQKTKEALRTRQRILFSTLSPDFINSDARGRMRREYAPYSFAVYAFKKGFTRNVSFSDETMYTIRYQDKVWSTYYFDETTLRGNYDITFRLPPVPESGSYEIRISGYAYGEFIDESKHNIVQFYIGKEGEDLVPCGDPVDMDKSLTDPSIGYVSDRDVSYEEYMGWVIPEDEEEEPRYISEEEAKQMAILANDDLMREHGYMKGPDSYFVQDRYFLREDSHCFRLIVSRQLMEEGHYYYLRIKQCNLDIFTTLALNYLEIVPECVYHGDVREDKH